MSRKQPKRDISMEEAKKMNKEYNSNLQKAANEFGEQVNVSYDNENLLRVALQHITLEEGKRIGVFHAGRKEAVLNQAGEFWAASRLKSPIPAQPSPRTWDPQTFAGASSSSASASTSGMFMGSLTPKPPSSVPVNPFASTSQSQPAFVFGSAPQQSNLNVSTSSSTSTTSTTRTFAKTAYGDIEIFPSTFATETDDILPGDPRFDKILAPYWASMRIDPATGIASYKLGDHALDRWLQNARESVTNGYIRSSRDDAEMAIRGVYILKLKGLNAFLRNLESENKQKLAEDERKRKAKQAEDAENARKQQELADKLAREAEAEKKRQEQEEKDRRFNSPRNKEAGQYILQWMSLADAIRQGFITPDNIVTKLGYDSILKHKQEMEEKARLTAQALALQAEADRLRKEQEEEQRRLNQSRLTGELSPGNTPDISMIQPRQSSDDDDDDEDSLLDLSENFRRGPPNRNPPTNPEMDEIRRALDKIIDFYDKLMKLTDGYEQWKSYIKRLGPQRALTATFGHPKVLAKLLPLILPSRAGRINGVVVQQFATFLGESPVMYSDIVHGIKLGGDGSDNAKFMLDPAFLKKVLDHYDEGTRVTGKSLEDEFDEWLAGSPSNSLDESSVDPNISGLDYTQQQSLQSSDVASGSTQPPIVQTTEDFIEISFYPDLINAGDQYGINDIITAQFTGRDLLFIAKSVKAQMGFV
jgi:hypothetical protein